MKTFVQFVTIPTADTPGTAILLHFDDKRYIFGNLAEGTQRACVERGIKLARVSDIFLTGPTTWSTHGGIMGMLLTLADALSGSSTALQEAVDEKVAELEKRRDEATNPSVRAQAEANLEKCRAKRSKVGSLAESRSTLSLNGGPNLAHTIATGRRFICRRGMPICVREFDGYTGVSGASDSNPGKGCEEPTLSDDHIKIWALPIMPSSDLNIRGRKRSHEEFKEGLAPSESPSSTTQEHQNRITCQAIVSEMFNSDWRLDTLVEMPLAEVSLPATLFERNPETQAIQPYNGPKPGDDKPLPDIRVLVRKPWPGALVESLPPTSPSKCSMSYIIRNHDIRGKFDPKKAQALGVQRGPDYRKLTEGQSVQSKDGETISPEMVLGETRIGKGVAIIELPTVEYIENLISRPEWKSAEVMKGMSAFIWILGKGVGSHPRLQEFISNTSQVKHIFASPDYSPDDLTFRAIARSTTEFSEVDSARYSVPQHSDAAALNMTQPEIRVAGPGMVVSLEPQFSINSSETEREIDMAQIKGSVGDTVRGHVDAVRQQFDTPAFQQKVESMRKNIPNCDAEIITLGTGSSLPSMYRNVSATLLRVPGHGSYLFDCGEGTLGQLKRVYAPEELKQVLRELKVIWISHLHADHHLGTVSLIKTWYEEVFGTLSHKKADYETNLGQFMNEDRLCIVSHIHMLDFLAEYAQVENFGYDKITPLAATSYKHPDGHISSSLTLHRRDANGLLTGTSNEWISFDSPDHAFTNLFQSATGLKSILTTPVSHCQGSKAVSLVFPSGLKVSYSGDCRPSEAFTHIGRDSTVLLHEATFEDDMITDALAKKHSTLSEALMVGREMGAKIIVLTHFSQRYREMPNIEKAKTSGFVPRFNLRKSNVTTAVRDIPATEEEPMADAPEAVDTADDLASKTAVAATAAAPKTLGDDVPVILAFDYMRLRLGDALHAEAYMPALKTHLSTSEVEF